MRLKVEWAKNRSQNNLLLIVPSTIIRAQNHFANTMHLKKIVTPAGFFDTATMPLPSQILFLRGFSCLMQPCSVHIALASGPAVVNYDMV